MPTSTPRSSDSPDRGFLAVSGASGSGKSSLVRAGVVPALQRRGDRVVILTPEHDLDVRIRDAVWGAGRADVVVVDQFEEVFHAGEADVDAAARAIADARGERARPSSSSCARTSSTTAPRTPTWRRSSPKACTSSARWRPTRCARPSSSPPGGPACGWSPGWSRSSSGMPRARPGRSPTCRTRSSRPGSAGRAATLTVAGYEASGGISGAIAQSADRLYQSMDPDQRVTCRSLLLRLVALGPDGSPVRRRVPSKPLRADAARDEVLTMLARSRLVSAEADSIEVAHESLATAWPRLQAWLEEDAEGTRILTAVAAAAEAWNAAGRPEDDLYRGARLQAAIEWRDAAPRDLTDVETAFLDASAARATAEQEQLAERARRDRRQNRRLRVLLGVAAGLIVLLVGAGSVAVVSSQEANAQRDSATIEALVGTALALRTSERDVSALLAAEAYRRWPDDPRTRSGLMSVLQGAGGFLGTAVPGVERERVRKPHPGHGATCVIVTTAGDAAIRDAGTGDVLRELDLGFDPGPTGPQSARRGERRRPGRRRAVAGAHAAGRRHARYGTSPQSDLVVFDLERGRAHHGSDPARRRERVRSP